MLKPTPDGSLWERMILPNGQRASDRLIQANEMEQALRLVLYRYERKLAPSPPSVIKTIRAALRDEENSRRG